MTGSQNKLEQEFISQIPFDPDDYQVESFKKITDKSNKDNFLVVLPTGAGKTLIAEYAIWLSKKNDRRVIYTNPLKALSTEKLNDWKKNYLKHCKVIRDTSDDIKNRSEENYKTFDCLITTNERLNSILRKKVLSEMVLKDIEYLIIDEIHLLGSVGRGSTLEIIIMIIRKKYPNIKIIGLSATLPNYKEFSDWLESEVVYLPASERPVPLKHYFESPIDVFVGGGIKKMKVREMTTRKSIQLTHIVDKYRGDQFLIFVGSRMRAKELAELFYKKSKTKVGSDITLDDLISSGLGFHHAGLDNSDRIRVEKEFKRGNIKLLFCTPTLAQGVNLPVKNVVLFDLSRFTILAGEHKLIYSYEIGQMNGRAGRRGYDTFGRSFYLGTDKEIRYARESVHNPPSMDSRLYENMDEHLLALNVIKIANTSKQITEIFEKSFLYHQDNNNFSQIPTELKFLLQNGFLELESERRISYATRYGILTSKFYVKPRTLTEILDNIKRLSIIEKINELQIIFCFLCNGEFLSSIGVTELDNRYIVAARDFLGVSGQAVVTVYDPDKRKYVKIDLIENLQKAMGLIFAKDLGLSVFGSAKEYGVIKKTASGFIDRTIVPLSLRPEYKKIFHNVEFKVKLSAKMVEIGTTNPKKANIMRIKGIGSSRYERLIKNGISSVEVFLLETNDVLSSILRLKEETIEKMKKYIMKNMTPEELQY